jgi:hypothetical protein
VAQRWVILCRDHAMPCHAMPVHSIEERNIGRRHVRNDDFSCFDTYLSTVSIYLSSPPCLHRERMDDVSLHTSSSSSPRPTCCHSDVSFSSLSSVVHSVLLQYSHKTSRRLFVCLFLCLCVGSRHCQKEESTVVIMLLLLLLFAKNRSVA